ncbi:PVR cell adhesion molecule related 2 like isoform X2 [Megalobrama amblycephala]|uniref:PVR cell adhesion molecule related 2 like isoform X2 n=1 Tax=Megalobrama amblycephala TaxID=75352 RepID=UPI002014267C|nr:PVR cell adhesion molecule related 2 like isoform X2 [Megalobrama amblycephala]
MSDFTMINCCLILGACLLSSQVVWSQRVRVEYEVTAYPNSSVNLRCEFINSGNTKLTQVSWMFERVEGDRHNIAVFHPTYGASFPNKEFEGRVNFTRGSLENPSIRIDKLKMADAGRYICEYATYPSGNEQGTTTLIMLAKPKNSATAIPVRAGPSEVVVANCEAAQGKPEATISWITAIAGRYNHTAVPEVDGTVTVKSEFRMVPTPAENGKEITCLVTQRTQSEPQSFTLKLVVEYPPTVTIDGYDNNWYIGRTDAVLTCEADANPEPTEITWTTTSGQMPPSVRVENNRLLVRKVDETVNTTFVCEVKNRLGAGKKELSATVIDQPLPKSPSAGPILGGIIAAIVILCLIGAGVAMYRKRVQSTANGEGPPKHKPPPPMKSGSSTEMLNKPQDKATTITEAQPLSNYETNYYETNSAEPVTDLDDDNTGPPANGGTPNVWDGSGHPPEKDESTDETLPPYEPADQNDIEVSHGNLAREESFMSQPMLV